MTDPEDESEEDSEIEDDLESGDHVIKHNFVQSESESNGGDSDMADESGEGEEEGEADIKGSSSQLEELEEESKLNKADTSKKIRVILNKVSEGNMDPMFKQLLPMVEELMPQDPDVFGKCYSEIFTQLTVTLA